MKTDTRALEPLVLCPEKRLQILLGAGDVFSEHGYMGASMSQIADRAGVSKGTLYNHFQSKSHLFIEWTSNECERMLETVFDVHFATDDVEKILREIGKRMLALMTSPTALVMYRMAIAEVQSFPHLARNFYSVGPARAAEMLERRLREWSSDGRLRITEHGFAAQQFLSLCQNHMMMQLRFGMIDKPNSDHIDAVVTASTAMFINHYGLQL